MSDFFRYACLALALALSLWSPAWAQAVTSTEITAAQALAAYDRFAAAPEQNLGEAPTFLKYMQGGAIHSVLNPNLLFWMYRPFPPDVQAVLYAAYMGGNLKSQLVTRKQGDDPTAGMASAVSAYTSLKSTHADLRIDEFEQLLEARRGGKLPAAIDILASGKSVK